jgi:tricarboxylate carrier
MADPKFSLSKPRYDQSTFAGRARHFYSLTDPRTLTSSRAEITQATSLLDQFARNNVPKGTTDAQLWRARALKEACVHPDTAEVITPVVRFAAFVPVNLVLAPYLLAPSTIASAWRSSAGHWLNQSYNAGVNYANRNATSTVPESTLLKAYIGAIASSISIAWGASALMKRAGSMGRPSLVTAVRATLPYLASVVAGCLNVGLIRQTELTEGVELTDHEGTAHGKSPVAGQAAIAKCCAARAAWNLPALMIPPLIMSRLALLPALRRSPRALLVTELGVIGGCLFGGVPLGLALFPQQDQISAERLGPDFQGRRDSQGQPIQTFFFNKGL